MSSHNDYGVWSLRFDSKDSANAVDKKYSKDDANFVKEKFAEIEEERLKQANRLRTCFVTFALIDVGIIILVSSIVVIILTFKGQLTAPVSVAFISTLGIEVIGILAIVARYLFSTPHSPFMDNA